MLLTIIVVMKLLKLQWLHKILFSDNAGGGRTRRVKRINKRRSVKRGSNKRRSVKRGTNKRKTKKT